MATTARPITAAPAPVGNVEDALADRRLADIWEAVKRPDVKVLSTDVFDTVLWRIVPEPAAAFGLLGARLEREGVLAGALSAAGFASLRSQAETRARELLRERIERHEVTLHEVYDLLTGPVFTAGGTAAHALRAEIELERDLLVPDLDVLALLRAAQHAGKQVVAVSDTYFTEAHLRRFLGQPALGGFAFDRIFASSAYRVGKSGGLFEIVLEELGVTPAQVVHIGDNEQADVEYPGKLGIACTPFPQRPPALQALMDAERRHVSRSVTFSRSRSDAGVAPDLTAIRGKVASRAEREAMPSGLRPYWDHGALVHGPVLTGFAEWVQERALDLGVTRLHGFMREGDFLGQLVTRAGEYMGTGITCGPLWLNREVLSAAAVGEATEEELAPLLVRRRAPTAGRFLRTLGLEPSDLPRFGGHYDTPLDDFTTRTNLLRAIESDDTARAKVLAHAAAQREKVVAYVRRELGGDAELVCVDLGWAGSAQGLLGQVLGHAGIDIKLSGLYLALHAGGARRVFEGMRASGFISEFGLPYDATKLVMRSPEILEQICMPDHGSQIALGDDLEPVLEQGGRRDPVQSAQADTVRKGVSAFQREWARYRLSVPNKLASLGGSPDLLRPLLVRSVVSPTPEEVSAFGGWLHDENQGSDAVEAVLDPAALPLLRHMDPGGLKDLSMSDLYWPFAAAATIDPTWAELIDLAASGELSWDALSGPADTGPFVVQVHQGVSVDLEQRVGDVPVRNRHGLSMVHGTLRGGAIQELVIRPCDRPAIVRLDHVELRCHVQGRSEPQVVTLSSPADFAGLTRINAFLLNPNLLIAHSFGAGLLIPLTERVTGHIFRVDVRVGFATMAIGEMLPTPGRVRSPEEAAVTVERLEAVVRDMQGSLSWRVTKPLRILKRLAGR